MSVEGALAIAFLVIIAIVARIRWKQVTRRTLTDHECRVYGENVCAGIFELGDRGEFVGIHPSAWASLTDSQAVELVRWMNGHNFTRTPAGWGFGQVLMSAPPTELALTDGRYDRMLADRSGGIVVQGDGNNLNAGNGNQVVVGRDLVSNGDFLRRLGEAALRDSRRLSGLAQAQVIDAGETLIAASRGDIPEESPRVRAAITWLRECAASSVGSAVGAGLWTATSAVLGLGT